MSNLAIGIALGAAMNSTNNISGGGGDIFIPAWLAIIMLVTVIIAMLVPIVELYRKDSTFLESHWERLIIGPMIGLCAWGCLAVMIGLLAFLCSFIF